MELVGRRAEREAVERLLAEARAGRSGSLTVLGEAGIGKTALLEHARQDGSPVRVPGGERDRPPVRDPVRVRRPPPAVHAAPGTPRRVARAAAGSLSVRRSAQQAGAAPDRFLVGLAVLNLLSEVAEEQPLLCIVDDAHWLDEASAQVLAFVARRVAAERLALLLCARDPTDDGDLRSYAGLPELRLDGLGDSDARTLLVAAVRTPLDDEVRDRIVAEARGNPLALLELPRSAPPGQLAGGFELPDALSVPRRIEEMFHQRSRDLPSETQLLLLRRGCRPDRRRGAAVARGRRAGDRVPTQPSPPRRQGCWRSTAASGSATHWCARPSTRRCSEPDRRRVHGALAAATDPGSTRTGARGTARRRCWAPTRRPPPTWNARPDGRGPAVAWPPRLRSCSVRSS